MRPYTKRQKLRLPTMNLSAGAAFLRDAVDADDRKTGKRHPKAAKSVPVVDRKTGKVVRYTHEETVWALLTHTKGDF